MPVFTNPIQSQNQATGAGIRSYPGLNQVQQNTGFIDEFQRSSINPTGGYSLYTTGAAASGTVTILQNRLIQLLTDVNINNYSSMLCSGISLARKSNYVDNRSQIILDVVFSFAQTTSCTFFTGLHGSSSVLTSIPTTAQNMGIYLDTGVSNNLFLTSSDGTTQTTTDTGLAIVTTSGTLYRCNINWTGNNLAIISLYVTTNSGTTWTLQKSQTVTSFTANPDDAFFPHYMGTTKTTAAKTFYIFEWGVSAL